MSARRLAVFDLDGTLVDSQVAILAAMAEAFAAAGRPVPSREATLGIVGLSLPVAMAQLAPDAAPEECAAMVAAYRAAFLRGACAAPPPLYPGARAMLEALAARGDVLLAVATGKSRRGLDAVLAGHRLAAFFVTTQVSDDHPSKPHPSMLRAALDAAGVPAARAAMIGDTRFDIDMARAAGVPALGVSWGYHPSEALAGADAVVSEMAAIAPALDRLCAAA
jgi:phosphoglycolate phosphatase